MVQEIVAEVVREGPIEGYEHSVAHTVLSNGYRVSTIETSEIRKIDTLICAAMETLGVTNDQLVEHSPTGFRADLSDPGEYETMVFSCDEEGNTTEWDELAYARYMSREEAEEGHKEMVEKWRRMKVVDRND